MIKHTTTNLSRRPTCITENFVVIWLDLDLNEIDSSILQLHHNIYYSIWKFDEPNSCIDFLTDIKDQKVFLILSSSLGENLTPLIHEVDQLDSIYICCGNSTNHEHWTKEWRKIKGIFTDISLICEQLKHNIRQCNENSTPVTIIPTSSAMDANELDPMFMYSQLLKEILLEINYQDECKRRFVDFLRTLNVDNTGVLHQIDVFEREYNSHSPIWWYTKESFAYSTVNNALRTQDILLLLKIGFFVRDLHQQIEQVHFERHQNTKLVVYRGQGISSTDFDKMTKSKGGLLFFNNFLSTSIDREVSLLFADTVRSNPDLTEILFQMEIDPSISSTPFASLDGISYYSDTEKEILFSMHTVFRIGDIRKLEDRLWEVNLTLTNDSDQELKRLTDHTRQSIDSGTEIHRLAALMMTMGEFDYAEGVITVLFEWASNEDLTYLAFLHYQFGSILAERGNLTSALAHYNQSLDIKLTYVPSNDPAVSTNYASIGSVLRDQGDLDGALQHYQRALDIYSQASEPHILNMISIHINIGSVLEIQGKYDEALQKYECALESIHLHLPPRHPSLAALYSNIGVVHHSMKDYSTALSYYQMSLDIKQKSLPTNHPSLAVSHYNLAKVFEDLNRYQEAIMHASRAVDIAQRSFGLDHSEVIDNQEYLDKLRQKL